MLLPIVNILNAARIARVMFILQVRQIFSDFSVLISIVLMVGLDMLVGIKTPKLEVPEKFQVRSWRIEIR